MPTIALAAYSIYSGVQASKSAKDDASKRDAATARQEALGMEDRKYYRDKFGPVNQMLIDYAMGNKPSPYLAKAKGQIEKGYQTGMQQLADISGRQGLGMSGIGEGQKIGLGMERAKTLAGLDLSDQAQRYGIAQGLGRMETQGDQGSRIAAGAQGQEADFANKDMLNSLGYANSAFAGAAKTIGAGVESAYGMKQKQADAIESGGNKTSPTTGGSAGGGLNRDEVF